MCFFSAGELTKDEIEKIVTILQHPSQFKVPFPPLDLRLAQVLIFLL